MSMEGKGWHAGEPAEGGVVGSSGTGKVDGLSRITGQARFTDDLKLPRMAYAKVLRSPHAHARILSIDASDALATPGVLAVITGPDIPGRYGPIPVAQDETALAIDKVRYVGEPVAAAAALTEEIAFAAVRKIRVAYEPLEPVFTAEDALNPSKPLIHEGARKASNVLRRVHQSYGDVDGGFAAADLVMEHTYQYPGSTHVALETQSALASPGADGVLTVWSSTQNPHSLHRTLAKILDIPTHRIRLIKPAVGAGYGGKCDPFVTDICAAFLARRLDRPVKFTMDREEVFYAHRGRHPTRIRLKMGMTRDGTLTALELEAVANGGAYSSYGVVTSYYLGVFGTIPYKLQNYRFTSSRVYTNLPPCGPKRGHGAIQPRFALEMHLDRMCEALGLDPVEVRLKNLVQPNTETANGLRVTSVALAECIEAVVAASGYRERRGRLGPGRGLGLACSAYMCGALHPVYQNEMAQSGVQLQVERSGRVTIFSGTADIGQGSNHMLATLVAERLGLAPTDCRVIEADSDLVPVDLGSYSSRVTFMAGNATLQAADRLRELIFSAVAEHLGVPAESLTARDRQIRAGDKTVSWEKAVELAETRHGTLGSTGSYKPPKIGNRFRRESVGPSPAYSFTAQVAEVAVDEETGELRIEQIWVAHDAGRVLHHEIAAGQVEGCVYMGVGEALSEEQTYQGGVMRTPSILEYRIPTVHETPIIHTTLIESHDPGGPFGAKEVGEGPQLSTVPAIANAIHDATGLWMSAPPYTPDRLWSALKRRARGT